jgi:type I restriction enzyme M protein
MRKEMIKAIRSRAKPGLMIDFVTECLTDDFASPKSDLERDVLSVIRNLQKKHRKIEIYNDFVLHFEKEKSSNNGVFYSPESVSKVCKLAVSLSGKPKSVYDPSCGVGSMLSPFLNDKIKIFGQDVDERAVKISSSLLETNEIKAGDTLTDPKHMDKKFEAIVSNPPFSLAWDANKLLLNDDRYSPYGTLAPKDKADMAFIQHNLHHLDDKGTAAVVVPNGVLFRSGAEGKIRKHIISEMNALDAVIGLPAGLFSGTGIPAAILIFKKCRQDSENVLFIDASAHFEKGKNQNLLRNSDVDKIIETLTSRETIEKYSQLVPVSDIADNDFNLNIPRYVDTTEKEAEIDVQALQDDINAVNVEIATLEAEMAGFLKELSYAL